DLPAVSEPAAQQVGGLGPRRQPPARGAGPVVGLGQGGQLGGVLHLGVRPHDLGGPDAEGVVGLGHLVRHVGNSWLMTARRLRAWPRVWTRRRRPCWPARVAAHASTSGRAEGSSRAARTGSAAGTSARAWPPRRR